MLSNSLRRVAAQFPLTAISGTQSGGPVSADVSSLLAKTGQTIIVFFAWDSGGSTPTVPSGWTSADTTNTSASYPSVCLCYKVSDGTEGVITVGGTDSNTLPVAWCAVLVKDANLTYHSHERQSALTGLPDAIANPNQLANETCLIFGALEDVASATLGIPSDSVQTLCQQNITASTDHISIAAHVIKPGTNNYNPGAYTHGSASDGNRAYNVLLR